MMNNMGCGHTRWAMDVLLAKLSDTLNKVYFIRAIKSNTHSRGSGEVLWSSDFAPEQTMSQISLKITILVKIKENNLSGSSTEQS